MARTHDKGQLADAGRRAWESPFPARGSSPASTTSTGRSPRSSCPCSSRSAKGSAGVGLKKCDTPEELTATFKEFVEGYGLEPDEYPLVQQFVEGEDYCVTTLFDQGTLRGQHDLPQRAGVSPGDGGRGAPGDGRLPEAEEAAAGCSAELGWHGMAELDFRVGTDGTAYLIEVNPRFFGGLSQAIAANVDYPHLLFRIAVGREDRAGARGRLLGPHRSAGGGPAGHAGRDRPRRPPARPVPQGPRRAGRAGPLATWKTSALKPLLGGPQGGGQPQGPEGLSSREMFDKHRDTINDVMQCGRPRGRPWGCSSRLP